MKEMRKLSALLLALVMTMSVALTGCGGGSSDDSIAPPDQVAEALMGLMFTGDPSALCDAWGYSSEDALAQELVDGKGMYSIASMMEAMADAACDTFGSSMGAEVSADDAEALKAAFVGVANKIEYSAEVEDMDEDKGTAVVAVTMRMPVFDSFDDVMTDAMTELLSDDPSLALDPDRAVSAFIGIMCDKMDELEMGEAQTSTMDFVLETIDVEGKDKKCWVSTEMDGLTSFRAGSAAGDIAGIFS